ncbi:MAG TPA: hypothetical protein VFG37_02805 [Planctomycetota bacterium]|jgi:hypothetical protein|nr:hypothetical protein [Planctomycetota bacterium]
MAELPTTSPGIPASIGRAAYRRPQRPELMTASSIVGKTMRIWISTLPQLLAVAALVEVPRLAVAWFFRTRPVSPTLAQVADAFENLELMLIPAVVGVFAVYFVFQRLRDEPADLGRSIALGLRRIGTGLGIFALFALPQLATVFLDRPAEDTSNLYHPMRVDSGSIEAGIVVGALVVVCNLVFALVFDAALPAALVERIGVFPALRRSARLTSGRRSTIFGANILFGLLTGLLAVPLFAVTSFEHGAVGELLLTSAVTWVASSLQCVFPIVLYHELRRTKEGFGAEELAKAFD